MAWLQSSFTNHQLLGDSSNNQKKSLKNTGVNKHSDPDKSDTPLLCEPLQSPVNDSSTSGWLKSTCNNNEKKQNLLPSSSKSSFLPHGFFDKSLGSSKGRMHMSQNSSGASNYGKKPAENMKLLSDEDNKKHPLFEDDDDDEEDSDEEWCMPRLGGYQKVRPCAE